MQVSVETTSGLERKLTITLPSDQIEQEYNKRVQQTAPKVQLNGFRKGKVPARVVKQRFGPGIRQEVLGEMMSSSFQDAVTQESLKPAGQPKVEPRENQEGQDFSFVATFEVYPEIELNDLSGEEIFNPVTDISDIDVDEMIANLRKQQATYEVVERPAQKDDQVNIDYLGTKAGEPFEGGSAEGSDLILGSNSMIPGFEDGILGMQAGDEKTLSLSFPDDYHAEELKGAAVEFNIKVNSISEQKLPEIDSDFLAKFGLKEGGEPELKAKVKENMEKELANALKLRVKSQVLDKLLEKNAFDKPQALVDQEINQMKKQMVQQFSQGQAIEDFDLSLLPSEMFQEKAAKRVALGLLLSKAIEQLEVKASSEDVRAEVEKIASGYDAANEVIDWYYNNQQQLAQVEFLVLENNVVNQLLEAATLKDESLSYQELMELVNAQAE